MPEWDVVIIARDTWGDVWRRRHCLAHEWARERKVLFVEPAVASKKKRKKRSVREDGGLPPGIRVVEDNIYVMNPVKHLPNSLSLGRSMNMKAIGVALKKNLKTLGFRNPLMWITAEFGVHFIEHVPHSLVVYDVTDDWTAATLPEKEMKQIVGDDRLLVEKADIIFTVSKALFDKKSKFKEETFIVPNGVRIELYEGVKSGPVAELEGINRPIVGYAGTLHSDRLDIGLIDEVARMARGRFSIVFIGPNSLDVKSMETLDKHMNVFIRPPVKFERLPEILASFDLCSIPHRITQFTNSLNPLKAFEYLASGTPIITTPVAEMAAFAEYVTFAEGPEKFFEAALDILNGNEMSTAEERKAAAREHSWRNRELEIREIIEEFTVK